VHNRRGSIGIAAVVIGAAALTITACRSSAPKAASAAGNAAAGNATAACKALNAWEKGPATDMLNDDPARAKIAQLGAGTKFGADFNTWINDDGSSAKISVGNQVSADCAAAGVPGIFEAAQAESDAGC
jgi:hypothetical protein